MAYFAQLDGPDLPATILQVIVIDDGDILGADGFESEAAGIAICRELVGTDDWVQTGHGMRYNIGAPLMLWDGTGFYSVSPYPSWTMDADYQWQPPTPKPDGAFIWDEDEQVWVDDST